MNKLREQLGDETLWGLPKNISDELIDSYQSTLFRWLGFGLFMFVMVGGFAVGAVIWVKAENIIKENAKTAAESINGFAIDTNFGIGLLIGLFVWIFLSGVIVSLVVRLAPMPAKGALFMSGVVDPVKMTPEMFNKKTSSLSVSMKPSDAVEFLNQYLDRTIAKYVKGLMPFIMLVVAVCYAELHSFSVFSPTGFHNSGFFSKDMTVRTWQDAQTIKLGCNQMDDGPNLIYEVSWPDGKDKRLPIDTHINAESWLTNLEAVDAEISEGDAVFVRWAWNNRNPLHPKCLRGFYAELNSDEKTRFDRLLRIGELD